MTLDTGGWNLTVFCLVFFLQFLVTPLAIFVKGELQVELLLVLGKLLFAFDRWFIMALHAFLNLVAFFIGVLAVLVHMMAFVKLGPVVFCMLLVVKGYRALGVL